MRRSDFSYELPESLIAQQPLPERCASRLLCLCGATGTMEDRRFAELPRILAAGDLLVLNDTMVIPARLYGRKPTGGRVEILVERITGRERALVHLRAGKAPRAGATVSIDGAVDVRVLARHGALFVAEFDRPVEEVLEAHGHVPLPPYIRRRDRPADRDRYQTVFAARPGAVAAPTAGLHISRALLCELAAAGIGHVFVTLHVGAGTFEPVRTEELASHRMHRERFAVDEEVCEAVLRTEREGGRVVAVGTTVVRSLESAAAKGRLQPCSGETQLFIRPGYRFQVVDAMLTNFHLPASTLIMLVAAFGGYANVMRAYRHAIREQYRFFSYGDAMFVTPHRDAVAKPGGRA